MFCLLFSRRVNRQRKNTYCFHVRQSEQQVLLRPHVRLCMCSHTVRVSIQLVSRKHPTFEFVHSALLTYHINCKPKPIQLFSSNVKKKDKKKKKKKETAEERRKWKKYYRRLPATNQYKYICIRARIFLSSTMFSSSSSISLFFVVSISVFSK